MKHYNPKTGLYKKPDENKGDKWVFLTITVIVIAIFLFSWVELLLHLRG